MLQDLGSTSALLSTCLGIGRETPGILWQAKFWRPLHSWVGSRSLLKAGGLRAPAVCDEAGHGVEFRQHLLHQASQKESPLFSNLSILCIPSSIYLNQLTLTSFRLGSFCLERPQVSRGSLPLLLSFPGAQWEFIKHCSSAVC